MEKTDEKHRRGLLERAEELQVTFAMRDGQGALANASARLLETLRVRCRVASQKGPQHMEAILAKQRREGSLSTSKWHFTHLFRHISYIHIYIYIYIHV